VNPRLPTFAAALCAVWCLPALAQDASKTPTFTADVQMVHLLVTVRTPEGRPTGDVARNEFRIFDNGVPQDLAVFDERSGQPLSVALLIDTSLSTKIKLKSEKDSVRAYLQALFSGGNPGDALSLFNFDWRVTQATGFTRNLKWLDDRLTAMISEGGTSLYDAIYLASKELDRRTGRHVMLVISDGGDTVSTKDFHAALRALHDADTVLYAILVVPVEADAGRNVGGENALYGLSTGTGGKSFTTGLGPALDGTFAAILQDLRTQYYLGYYPKGLAPTRDQFHQLRVEVSRPGYTVESRTGYYAPPSPKSDLLTDEGPKREQ
jgi:Ca-activated chloride channel homolog